MYLPFGTLKRAAVQKSGPDGTARGPILGAAIRVFSRQGYAGTSVQDILREVGVSKPALYYHFESKAGLFRAILDHAFDECLGLMKAGIAGLPPGEQQLVAVAHAMFRFASSQADLTRLVFASLFAAPGEVPAECMDPSRRRRNFELVRELLGQAREAGVVARKADPDDLAHAFLGSISHRIRSQLLTGQGTLDLVLARRLVDLFLDGARPRPLPAKKSHP